MAEAADACRDINNSSAAAAAAGGGGGGGGADGEGTGSAVSQQQVVMMPLGALELLAEGFAAMKGVVQSRDLSRGAAAAREAGQYLPALVTVALAATATATEKATGTTTAAAHAAATGAAAVRAVLACISAAADVAAAWEQVLQQLQAVAARRASATATATAPGGAVAALMLATKLLQGAATAAAAAALAPPSAAAAAGVERVGAGGGAISMGEESCKEGLVLLLDSLGTSLDQWLCDLASSLQQQAAGAAADDSSSSLSSPAAAGAAAAAAEVKAAADDSSSALLSSSSLPAAAVVAAAEAKAVAELLGCALGANGRVLLLLSAGAAQKVLEGLLQGLRGYVVGRGGQGDSGTTTTAAAAAAGGIVLVLEQLLSSSAAADDDGSDDYKGSDLSNSSATAWQLLCKDYSPQLWELLLLVYQLSWGSSGELEAVAVVMAAAAGDGGATAGDDGSGSDDESSSVVSYGSSADDDEVAAAPGGTRGVTGVTEGVGVTLQHKRVQGAAEGVWRAAGVVGAVRCLATDAKEKLLQQLQQLLVKGLSEATHTIAAEGGGGGGAAAAAGGGGGGDEEDSVHEQGWRWAHRVATAVAALSHQQQQQQYSWQQQQQQLQANELLSALLSMGDFAWCQWAVPSSSNSSSSGVYQANLMVEFTAALVLQLGAACLLQLPVTTATTSSSSSSSSLVLELLCQHQAAVAAGEETEAVAEAAALLQSQLVSQAVAAAAAGGGGAVAGEHDLTSAPAAKQLLYLMMDLLRGACQSPGATADDGSAGGGVTGRGGVYSRALVALVKAVADRSKSKPQLVQLLQVFVSQGIAAAVLQSSPGSSTSSSSRSGLAEAVAGRLGGVQVTGGVLLLILPVCATALRGVSVEAVAAGRLDVLAVLLGRQALDVLPGTTTAGSTVQGADGAMLLRQVLSCFPVTVQISLPKGAAAGAGAGAGSTADRSSSTSSSTGGEPSGPLKAGACTAPERQVLMALLRHYGGTSSTGSGTAPTSAAGAGSGSTSTSTAAAAAGGAEAGLGLMSELQLICTAYCWSDMAAAEWHAVLRDIQQYISAARAEMQRLSGRLAATICTAAQQLLGSTAAADGSTAVHMSPDTAAALLFKLSAKGLLQKHPAYSQLLTSQREALTAFKLPATALPSLQLLAAVLQLQPVIQAGGRAPQLQLALSSSQSEVAAMFLAVGAALAVASTAGAAAVAPVLSWMDQYATAWQALASCLSYADEEAKMAALSAADARSAMVGVDAVSCLLALLRCPAAATARGHPHHHHHQHHYHHHHHHPQQNHHQAQQYEHQAGTGEAAAAAGGGGGGGGGVSSGHDAALHAGHTLEVLEGLAWQLLLSPRCLSIISYVAAAASSSSSGHDSSSSAAAAGGGGGELPEYDDDVEGYLTAVGLRPEMAAGLALAKPWAPHLLQWALLLAHLQTLQQQQQQLEAARRLSQALREVSELVPQLLDRVVSLMPSAPGGSSSSSRGSARGKAGHGSSSGSTAAVQLAVQLQQLGGEGADWRLQQLLSVVGLPVTHAQWQLLAAGVYRAVLWLLPASARLWFGDLRDKARAAAVEGYTVRFESPALLAAEFGAIRRGSGTSGENFKVRANAGMREVVAVLEIEDGATLELLVKLPAAAPLKVAEVECRNKVRRQMVPGGDGRENGDGQG
jgi:hypothetical protein